VHTPPAPRSRLTTLHTFDSTHTTAICCWTDLQTVHTDTLRTVAFVGTFVWSILRLHALRLDARCPTDVVRLPGSTARFTRSAFYRCTFTTGPLFVLRWTVHRYAVVHHTLFTTLRHLILDVYLHTHLIAVPTTQLHTLHRTFTVPVGYQFTHVPDFPAITLRYRFTISTAVHLPFTAIAIARFAAIYTLPVCVLFHDNHYIYTC